MRYFTAGESHGPELTAIVEGVPAGLRVSEDQINTDLARRQSGYGRGGRQKIERDTVRVTGGIRFGRTLGSPVSMVVRNRDNVRMCHGCLRVTIGTREENDILLNALKECK